MTPQGDTASKKSMGGCGLLYHSPAVSRSSLLPKKDMKVMYCCKQGAVDDKYFLCSLQKASPDPSS